MGSPANVFFIFGKLSVHSWFYLMEVHTNILPNILFILCNIKKLYQSKHKYIWKTFRMSNRAKFFDLR